MRAVAKAPTNWSPPIFERRRERFPVGAKLPVRVGQRNEEDDPRFLFVVQIAVAQRPCPRPPPYDVLGGTRLPDKDFLAAIP